MRHFKPKAKALRNATYEEIVKVTKLTLEGYVPMLEYIKDYKPTYNQLENEYVMIRGLDVTTFRSMWRGLIIMKLVSTPDDKQNEQIVVRYKAKKMFDKYFCHGNPMRAIVEYTDEMNALDDMREDLLDLLMGDNSKLEKRAAVENLIKYIKSYTGHLVAKSSMAHKMVGWAGNLNFTEVRYAQSVIWGLKSFITSPTYKSPISVRKWLRGLDTLNDEDFHAVVALRLNVKAEANFCHTTNQYTKVRITPEQFWTLTSAITNKLDKDVERYDALHGDNEQYKELAKMREMVASTSANGHNNLLLNNKSFPHPRGKNLIPEND